MEEVLVTLASLVHAGKIRYYGLSNVPAWYAAKMSTLATANGLPGPIGLQFAYSLIDRGVEHEHLAAARECGMGMVPWSPLGGGYFSGRYGRHSTQDTARDESSPDGKDGENPASGTTRLSGPDPFGKSLFTIGTGTF